MRPSILLSLEALLAAVTIVLLALTPAWAAETPKPSASPSASLDLDLSRAEALGGVGGLEA